MAQNEELNLQTLTAKILEWVDKNSYFEQDERYQLVVSAKDLEGFINELTTPTKKIVRQFRTKDNQEWRPISDSEYEISQHLSRFEFREIEE